MGIKSITESMLFAEDDAVNASLARDKEQLGATVIEEPIVTIPDSDPVFAIGVKVVANTDIVEDDEEQIGTAEDPVVPAPTRMIDIMARIAAIYSTAKRYHWQCRGKLFYNNHEFFDRLADGFSQSVIDGLAEMYYMNHQENVSELNEFDDLVANYVGEKFTIVDLENPETSESMFHRLHKMIDELVSKLDTDEYGQGIKSVFDELAKDCAVLTGLLSAQNVQ